MNDAHTLYEFEGAGYRVVDAKALYGRHAILQTGYVEEGVGYSEAAAEELLAMISSVKVFHSPHEGHLPNHLGVS